MCERPAALSFSAHPGATLQIKTPQTFEVDNYVCLNTDVFYADPLYATLKYAINTIFMLIK